MKDRDSVSDELGLEPEALFMDGYDDCIVGAVAQFGRPDVVCYDLDKVIESLMKQGMTHEEAEEFWSFNQLGGWHGDYTPVFLRRISE